MEEKAIQEVNAALEKEYFESYDTQLFDAANKALKALGVSDKSIKFLLINRRSKPLISSWVHQIVIKERLEKIFDDLQAKRDLGKASDIEKLLFNSRRQIGFTPLFEWK
jgi:hypothetical protein